MFSKPTWPKRKRRVGRQAAIKAISDSIKDKKRIRAIMLNSSQQSRLMFSFAIQVRTISIFLGILTTCNESINYTRWLHQQHWLLTSVNERYHRLTDSRAATALRLGELYQGEAER